MRQPVGCKQFLEGLCEVFRVVGATVTTTAGVNTGLSKGQHLAKIVKGTGVDSNLVTITLNQPFGMIPAVFFQAETLDCECRIDVEPTLTVIKVRTLKSTNLATKVDDANFTMFLFGTEGIYEGSY